MSLISQTVASHRINFDHRGTPRIFQAPGRVNLIGDIRTITMGLCCQPPSQSIMDPYPVDRQPSMSVKHLRGCRKL
jgi:hypothetical protein